LNAEILKAKSWLSIEYEPEAERKLSFYNAYLKIKVNGEVRMYRWWEVFDFGVARNRIKRWKKVNGELEWERYYDNPYDLTKMDKTDRLVFEFMDKADGMHRIQL